MENSLHTRSFIAQAWGLFKKHWKFIIPAGIATLAVMWLIEIIFPTDRGWGFLVLNYIIGTLLSLALSLGWAQVLLRMVRGNSSTWSDFKTQPRLWGKYFIAQLLVSLVMLVCFGIIMAVVLLGLFSGSGIAMVVGAVVTCIAVAVLVWFSIRMSFLVFIALDHSDLGIVAMLKKAFAITQGNVWMLIKLAFWQLLVTLLGIIALVVGLIVAIPVVYLASVCAYIYITSGKKVDHAEKISHNEETKKLPE